MLALAPALETTARPDSPRVLVESLIPVLDGMFGLDRSGVFPEEIASLLAQLDPGDWETGRGTDVKAGTAEFLAVED
ncbi:hypothetical protein [Methylobacterium nodulans]|uniref:Uncharacterized protein n=1 Tax=Methylobacterium nodulans (strain LMG 21967 / CNCM I-2342 / ORS 2060) TaxID=460265 RepID=B8ICA8_METNO|nr:hypothetical protein [Methylobacterium nodulans]ACL55496.1 conserved hypothetical protein [Methylobacterium nodulans ORS 2060]